MHIKIMGRLIKQWLLELHAEGPHKHKPTNVGRIALERQARQFNSWSLV